MRAPFIRIVVKSLLLAAAYFGCAMVTRFLKNSSPSSVSILWLPWGLLLGALAVSPRREWIWLLLATAPADYVFNLVGPNIPFWHWFVSRLLYYVAAYLGLFATELICGAPVRLRTVREAVVLFGVAGIGTQLIASTNYAINQHLMGDPRPLSSLWASWCMPSVLSFVLLTPLFIFWTDRHRRDLAGKLKSRPLEALLLFATYALIHQNAAQGGRFSLLGFQASIIVLVVWASLRLGPGGTVSASVFSILLAAVLPVRVLLVETASSPNQAALAPDIAGLFAVVMTLAVGGFAGYIIALALDAQEQSEAKLVKSNAELTEALVAKERKTTELEHTNQLLRQSVLRAEELARELTTANRALSTSDQARLAFVRTLSHELRNPIAGARMMADSLQRADCEDPARHRQIVSLKSCVDYLQTLLDDTLDISQFESGHVAIKLETFTSSELVHGVAALFGKLAEEKNLTLEVTPGSDGHRVLLGDVTHTKRILINYLSNALKFTTQGTIRLAAEPINCAGEVVRLRFSVSDTGPGINPALRERLFTKFIRETSHDRTLGAGLGLALCRQLADLAGGTVGCDSQLGAGSLFWVELPFIVSEPPASNAPDELRQRPDLSHLSVCVVDDNPLQVEAMAALLGEFGVVPETRTNFTEALALLKQRRFDLVFADYHLPEATGIQLLETLNQTGNPSHSSETDFYLVSGLWNHELAAKAIQAGFRASFQKPINAIELYRILKSTRADRT